MPCWLWLCVHGGRHVDICKHDHHLDTNDVMERNNNKKYNTEFAIILSRLSLASP
jgi:hypothetical protein